MGKSIRVTAKRHPVVNSPLMVSAEGFDTSGSLGLRDKASGKVIPAQVMYSKIVWIEEKLLLGETREYELINDAPAPAASVELVEKDDRVDFVVGGKLYTSYHFKGGDNFVRPFLWPVFGPDSLRVTRNFPMEDIDGEKQDHKHHRSIWVAHGDIDGADNWSEDTGHASQVHREFLKKTSGPVFGQIKAVNDWVDKDGKKQLEEKRKITIYNLPDSGWLIDLKVIFKATEGDVKFGDTKEGGIAAVRVATSMDGERDGLITNSIGGITEAENWGKPAHWVDYTGPAEGRTVGVAIFDTPGNFRYPTRWHVRDYGLFAANPFALSDYLNDKSIDGGHVVKSGETFKFAYRLCIHDGDTKSAKIGKRYHAYINPPEITVE